MVVFPEPVTPITTTITGVRPTSRQADACLDLLSLIKRFGASNGTTQNPSVILRVCDFFDVVKNRGCKQNSYDEKLVINSKKSQTLSGVSLLARERTYAVDESLAAALPQPLGVLRLRGNFATRSFHSAQHDIFV